MKIGLVNPAWGDRRAGLNSTALYRSVPPQGLLQLASLTPLEHEVTITDESWQVLDFKKFYSFGSLVRRFNWRLSPFNQLLWLMMQTFSA